MLAATGQENRRDWGHGDEGGQIFGRSEVKTRRGNEGSGSTSDRLDHQCRKRKIRRERPRTKESSRLR